MQLRHFMFDYHYLTLKEGFEVKSGTTKLSELMYDTVLVATHYKKVPLLSIAIPQFDNAMGVKDQIRHCLKGYILWSVPSWLKI